MKLLDTNVFLYASGVEHPYREPSIRILAMTQDGSLEANTNVEVVQEILHLHQARKELEFGISLARQALELFPNALPVTAETARSAVALLSRYAFLQSRDAIHAAVVLEHNLEGIISADRAFDGIAGLRRFDPKELAA